LAAAPGFAPGNPRTAAQDRLKASTGWSKLRFDLADW
jgi:hypothetical protein